MAVSFYSWLLAFRDSISTYLKDAKILECLLYLLFVCSQSPILLLSMAQLCGSVSLVYPFPVIHSMPGHLWTLATVNIECVTPLLVPTKETWSQWPTFMKSQPTINFSGLFAKNGLSWHTDIGHSFSWCLATSKSDQIYIINNLIFCRQSKSVVMHPNLMKFLHKFYLLLCFFSPFHKTTNFSCFIVR